MIVGLGNPGRKYERTRHNVGFDLVDRLAGERGLEWRPEKKWKAELARTADGGLVLVKPQTYMNLSGEAVIKVCSFFKIPPTEVLVVYDDADLPLGRLRFRPSGSAGGHNGVRSLIQHFGTDRFPRLKFGIGRDPSVDADPRRDMVSHVLGRFEAHEIECLEKNMANATEAVNCALSAGLPAAMNRFNQIPVTTPPKPKKNPGPRRAPSESPSPNEPSPSTGDSASSAEKPTQET